MKLHLLSAIFVVASLVGTACSQDSGSAAPAGQNSGQGPGGGYGRGGGMGMGGPGMGMMGRGLTGTVTAVAADHYTIKTDVGDVYTVKFTSDTRIMKQGAGMRGQGGGGGRMGENGARSNGGGRGNAPQRIKATDVKAGDVVNVMGDTDTSTKTVSAMAIVQMDPERVKAMREMEANFGKTWLMGKVTAIDGTKITLTGSVDSALHSVVADENTTFRKRRDPITLADIQAGDMIRVDGAVKDGVFTATSVNVMGGMMGGETPTVPRTSPPQ